MVMLLVVVMILTLSVNVWTIQRELTVNDVCLSITTNLGAMEQPPTHSLVRSVTVMATPPAATTTPLLTPSLLVVTSEEGACVMVARTIQVCFPAEGDIVAMLLCPLISDLCSWC